MIIYNVTVKIDNEVHNDWLNWMRTQHIPDVMATGKFIEYRMTKVMMDDPEGTNYSIQYLCNSMDDLQDYQENHAKALQEEHLNKYKDKFVAFRTLLEMVDHNSNL
tara:strand:- start:80 stop:397 length:318 start_codon:yes stop_codon:yes gene_type:complete